VDGLWCSRCARFVLYGDPEMNAWMIVRVGGELKQICPGCLTLAEKQGAGYARVRPPDPRDEA
jgi:hypothetical protein